MTESSSNPTPIDRPTATQYLARKIWNYRLQGVGIFFLGLAAAATQVAVLVMLKPALEVLFTRNSELMVQGLSWLSETQRQDLAAWIDRILIRPDEPIQGVYIVVTCLIIFATLNLFFTATHRHISRMLSRRFQIEVFRELFDNIVYTPLLKMKSRRQGDVMSRFTTDITMIQDAVLDISQILLKDPFFVLFALTSCFVINWKVTLTAVAPFPILAIAIAVLSKKVRNLARNESEIIGSLFHKVAEAISGLAVLKVYQSEERLKENIKEGSDSYLHTVGKIIRIEAMMSPVIDFLGYIGVSAAILFLAPLVFSNSMTVGELITIVALLLSVYKPIKTTSQTFHKLSRSLAGTDRILDLLSTSKESTKGTGDFPEKIGEIEFRNLDFAYEKGENILSNFNASLPEGKTTAIVGTTGAGKSTLISLLPMLYPLPAKSLYIGGMPIEDIHLKKLRAKMALVSQEVVLFNDTVARNIALDQEVPLSEIQAAARAAHAHEFIMKLPQGYDTPVGDRGARLSGGQCQRISIARAILKNPPILLLDEATSSLDAKTEQEIQMAIDTLAKDRTTVVVAHRLSTVQKADQILVMDHGKVVESGTHEELLERSGVYSGLYSTYFQQGEGS